MPPILFDAQDEWKLAPLTANECFTGSRNNATKVTRFEWHSPVRPVVVIEQRLIPLGAAHRKSAKRALR